MQTQLISLPAELKEKLSKAAKENMGSEAQIIRIALKKYFSSEVKVLQNENFQ